MKAIHVIAMIVVATMLCGSASAQAGPAPNAGDGVSDGSGMESPYQDGEPSVDSPGPAPNAGDGVPDGSGF